MNAIKRYRFVLMVSIVLLFFLSQGDGFVPMALYDGASGLALLLTYIPVVTSAPR